MSNVKHLLTGIVILTAISSLWADDWQGFHGLEKEGRCDSATTPLNWSPSNNIAWKTAIPGRGHSSPILSGDRVYLTTAYKSSRFFPVQTFWNYAIFALTLLLTITGISLASENVKTTHTRTEALRQHAKAFLFAALLGGVITVTLFGRALLDLDYRLTRAWLGSIMIVFCCLTLGLLFVSLKSRRLLSTGILSLIFTVPAFIALEHKGLSWGFGSLESLIVTAASVSPLIFGLALLATYFLSRKLQPPMIQGPDDPGKTRPAAWPLMITGAIGLIFALAPFFLLIFRAAGFQFSDSSIWRNRIRPDVSWWCIGIYVALALIAIAGTCRKSARSNMTKKLPLQTVFFAAALTLGSAFFVYVNFVERPKEFVRAVLCLNRDNGRILWTCEGLVGQKRGRNKATTYATPTPVTDGERIYGYFGEDGLMCVSPEGKIIWKKTELMFRGSFGAGTSPVLKDNALIVFSDVAESKKMRSSITAYDCTTGRPLWSKERKSHEKYAAYSTPIIKSIGGKQVVIAHGWHDVKGYHLETGQELWSYPFSHEGRHLVAGVASDAARLYVMGVEQVIALDISKLETDNNPLLWSAPIDAEKSSTPVVIDGLLFLVTETGMAFCLEAQTGKVLWEQRLRGRYFSSVLATGNQVLFTNESGQTTIVAIDREFRQLAKNSLGESIYASLAPAGNQLFVRTVKHLYCIQQDGQ